MTTNNDRTESSAAKIIISIDGMGGDGGLEAILGGMESSADKNPNISFILHGDSKAFEPLLANSPKLAGRVDMRHAEKIISMDEKPSRAMRHGKGSSMWNALASVENGEAAVAVSCGNTGALMAISMLRLRKLPGIIRPAIAVLWPSYNPQGHNILLDLGADIKADAQDLLQYAIMGASYARNGLGVEHPRIGLLNVGTEDHKGRPELQEAAVLIKAAEKVGGFEYVGFVEGSDMSSDKIDIIVTDGFTGNVALKAGEGTAKLIRGFLKEAFSQTPLARLAAVFAMASLKRLSKRIDPNQSNGGVFLGLNGTVVKSHGAANATGVSAAIKLAYRLAEGGFSEKVAARVASNLAESKDAEPKVDEA